STSRRRPRLDRRLRRPVGLAPSLPCLRLSPLGNLGGCHVQDVAEHVQRPSPEVVAVDLQKPARRRRPLTDQVGRDAVRVLDLAGPERPVADLVVEPRASFELVDLVPAGLAGGQLGAGPAVRVAVAGLAVDDLTARAEVALFGRAVDYAADPPGAVGDLRVGAHRVRIALIIKRMFDPPDLAA